MKMFWKTEDRAIDNLLRAHRGEQADVQAPCPEFDPDLANAYIEHRLTPAERASYERHISLCSPCRKSVVALARMAQAEAGPSIAGSEPLPAASSAGWLASLKGLFAGLARPQVAIAAVAMIALAVSLPILLSRESSRDASAPAPASSNEKIALAQQAAQASPAVAESLPEEAPPASQPSTGNPTMMAQARRPADAAGSAVRRDESGPQPGDGEKVQVEQQAVLHPSQIAQADLQKAEVKTENAPAAEVSRQAAEETRKEDAAAPKPAAPLAQAEKREELARIDPEEALRVKRDKDPVVVTELKPGRAGADSTSEKDRKVAIRPEDAVAPTSETPSGESSRRSRIANNQPGRAFRRTESRPAAPKRGTPERRAGGKKFYLLGDVWTDKDYRPDKEMPVVTLIRDSELYKEVLEKNSGLKVYFNRFVEQERAIIVYKDTVYKIDPPQK